MVDVRGQSRQRQARRERMAGGRVGAGSRAGSLLRDLLSAVGARGFAGSCRARRLPPASTALPFVAVASVPDTLPRSDRIVSGRSTPGTRLPTMRCSAPACMPSPPPGCAVPSGDNCPTFAQYWPDACFQFRSRRRSSSTTPFYIVLMAAGAVGTARVGVTVR
ncbi:hypothetical protein FA95DRAFT_491160 [Auriscalpium vulgare]|uniref:Uncharacterized protein n=1 Tax=Auriscalpium vulgare TaxID=40419 RepID=A0ACB8SBY0_9AGAM|nr:hypothetical protein FA95DRAFT_491160 [Auriscalpium vulgare]